MLYVSRRGVSFYPIITAHSGCEKIQDNSIEHIRTAIASGAELFEIDINECNGTLYLIRAPLDDYTDVPTLASCFEMAAAHPSICINCDVKSYGLITPVIELEVKYGIHRVCCRMKQCAVIFDSGMKLLH